MLILPIVNKNRVLNVRLTLKSASKVHKRVVLNNVLESEVLVSSRKFSDSMYNESNDKNAVVKFIRNNTTLRGKKVTITTKLRSDAPYYDVYEASMPPERVNDCLDMLYSLAITDLRKEMPNNTKGRYISLKQIGLDEILTDDKLDKLYKIISTVKDASKWPQLFEQANIFDIVDVINFLEIFDLTVIPSASINEDAIGSLLEALKKLKTKDYMGFKKYYEMAIDNKESYRRLSYAYGLLYGKSYSLIQSNKQKASHQFVKVGDNYGG